MKKNVFNTIVLFIAGIILYSCSEDPVKPPPTTDNTNKYFPLFEGSWWTYTNYELDDNGNKVATSEFSSKYIIGGTDSLEGKEAFRFDIQDLAGVKIEDSKYFYASKTQIFEFSKLLPPLDFSLPINIPETWYKMGDESGSEWLLYSEELDSAEFQFGLYKILFDDAFDIKVKNEGFEDVTYGANLDKTIKARKYKVSYSFAGNSILVEPFSMPLQMPFTVESYLYYGENVGLVKQEMKPMSIQSFYKLPGSIQILLDYEITTDNEITK